MATPSASVARPSASPASTDPGAASPTAAADVWQYLADFPAGDAIDVAAVAHTGANFVAVGSEPAEPESFFGPRQGVVWTSDDGRVWQRNADEVFANATLLHVVVAGDTTYVFGLLSACAMGDEDCQDVPEAGMTVWRSTDGGWERLPQSRQLREAFLAGVLALGETVVAFGDREDVSGSGAGELAATVWLSDDGAGFEEVTELVGMDPISAATAGPDGIVAFGTRLLPGTEQIETVAAYSDDGRSFELAGLPAGLDVVIESVVFGPSGFVAVGAPEDAETSGHLPTVLTSDDGRSWREVSLGGSFSRTTLHQAHALPDGYLLIGSEPSEADPQRDVALSWVSADGETWEPRAALAGGHYRMFNGSAVGPAGIVAFALDYEDETVEGPLSTIRGWFAPLDAVTLP
ncbi:MAG TPA: hypothetical protein VK992_00980 [Candidatus Caenarcaniphilales bacterium]|nr:hypothetical protein [Candidatus Caenarcaniphilales bacterium]